LLPGTRGIGPSIFQVPLKLNNFSLPDKNQSRRNGQFDLRGNSKKVNPPEADKYRISNIES